jgi:hypothetical protein
MNRLYDLWPPHAFRSKTLLEWIDPASGYGIAAIGKALKGNPNPANAIASLPVPVPTPPVTAANAQVLDAEQNFAKQTLGQKTVSDTIYAGNTGGFRPGEQGYPGMPVAPKSFKKGL